MRNRVLNQVREHSLQQRLISLEQRSVVVDVYSRLSSFLLESMRKIVLKLCEQSGGRDLLVIQRHRCFLDARNLQNVFDQGEQILCLPFSVRDRFLLRAGQTPEVSITEHLERCENRSERSFEIVHD